MKKTMKKLVLAKVTLRILDNETIQQAAVGASGGWTCPGSTARAVGAPA